MARRRSLGMASDSSTGVTILAETTVMLESATFSAEGE
jgi:hypothetical protein